MKYALIDEYVGHYSVALMCHALCVSRSGYYRWRDRPVSQQAVRKFALEGLIKTTYEEFKAVYGAPRITEELNALGHPCSVNFVAKIMKENGILARNGKGFNYGSHALTHHNVADNLLRRKFDVEEANQKWVSDITYIWVGKRWLVVLGDRNGLIFP